MISISRSIYQLPNRSAWHCSCGNVNIKCIMANIATFVAATSAAVATFGGDEAIGAVDIGQS